MANSRFVKTWTKPRSNGSTREIPAHGQKVFTCNFSPDNNAHILVPKSNLIDSFLIFFTFVLYAHAWSLYRFFSMCLRLICTQNIRRPMVRWWQDSKNHLSPHTLAKLFCFQFLQRNVSTPQSARESARARQQMPKQRHNSDPNLLRSVKVRKYFLK